MIRAALIFACLAGPALAHDWYDAGCCSGKDCAALPAGSVVAQPGGWFVTLAPGEHPMAAGGFTGLIPYDDERLLWSRDQDFHACLNHMQPGYVGLICLYVPGDGA